MALCRIILLTLALIQLNISQSTIDFALEIHSNVIVNRIPVLFFGFTLDWWKPTDHQNGYKWGDASILFINLSNPILINLTKALTPAILRLGGSPQDSIVYNISGMCDTSKSALYGCGQSGINYGCLNESRWMQILQFIDATQLSLIFGLNACFGRPNRSSLMNYTNIVQLFNFTIQQYQSSAVESPIYAFELGNEIEWSIDGDAYAQDFANIKSIIDDYWNNAKLSHPPHMIGPDAEQTNDAWQWNVEILETLNTISKGDVPSIQGALTYHHYTNCGSPNGNVSVFNLGCLSSIEFMATNYTTKLADAYGVDVMMGEGSGHSGGGVLNLTNVFTSSFYYLYQLCELVRNGVKGSLRSDLMGGYYELINHTTTVPTPDYWVLYVWRQYIGDIMYNSSLELTNDTMIRTDSLQDEVQWNLANDYILDEVKYLYNASQETYVRAYAFSFRNNVNDYMIVLINYHLWNTARVNITIQHDGNKKYFYDYEEYHMVGVGADGLKTKHMQINGVTMEYKNEQFPVLKPVTGNGMVRLSPKTIAWIHVIEQN